MPRLLCLGLGFSAFALARRLKAEGWSVIGTTRTPEKARRLETLGIEMVLFDGVTPLPASVFEGVTQIVSSIAPDAQGDPVLRLHRSDLGRAEWIGYLSTTGVYGDHQGGWVDEETPPIPDVPRSIRRLAAERDWQALPTPAHIFRLAGIYGPGRSAIEQIRSGTAHRIRIVAAAKATEGGRWVASGLQEKKKGRRRTARASVTTVLRRRPQQLLT